MEKTTDVGRVLPLCLKYPRVCPCECGWIIHEDPLFPIPPKVVDSTLQRMQHLWMDAWPYFPGIKVGQIYVYSSSLYSSLFDLMRARIIRP